MALNKFARAPLYRPTSPSVLTIALTVPIADECDNAPWKNIFLETNYLSYKGCSKRHALDALEANAKHIITHLDHHPPPHGIPRVDEVGGASCHSLGEKEGGEEVQFPLLWTVFSLVDAAPCIVEPEVDWSERACILFVPINVTSYCVVTIYSGAMKSVG